jgi:hypothetical protein
MKPWAGGIGGGEIFLLDQKTRVAYGQACRAAIIDSAARHVINLGSLDERRAFIAKYPAKMQDSLKARIKEIWEEK